MTDNGQFLRGSRVLEPITHIIVITLKTGGQLFRRCSLTAAQMRCAELNLMELQHRGEIRGYLITAAEDVTFERLLQWLHDLEYHPEQTELISIEQNTLFAGGGQ